MKKIILSAMVAFAAATSARADEIRLINGSVIRGKITRVETESIEYKPEDNRPSDMIPRSQVLKIVYDNGTSADFPLDRIYMDDGTIITGRVLEVKKISVVIFQSDTKQTRSLDRYYISKIDFGYGATQTMDRADYEAAWLEEYRTPSNFEIAFGWGFPYIFHLDLDYAFKKMIFMQASAGTVLISSEAYFLLGYQYMLPWNSLLRLGIGPTAGYLFLWLYHGGIVYDWKGICGSLMYMKYFPRRNNAGWKVTLNYQYIKTDTGWRSFPGIYFGIFFHTWK